MNKPLDNREQLEEQISAYLLGDLKGAEAEAVRRLLDEDEGCRALAQELRLTLDLLRDALVADTAPVPARLSPSRRRRLQQGRVPAPLYWIFTHKPVLANAAVLMILCMVLGTVVLPGVSNTRNVTRKFSSMSSDESAPGTEYGLAVEFESEPALGPGEPSSGRPDSSRSVAPTDRSLAWGVSPSGSGRKGAETRGYYFDATTVDSSANDWDMDLATPPPPPDPASTPAPVTASGAIMSHAVPESPVALLEEVRERRVPLRGEIPPPRFAGTPVPVKTPNLESAKEAAAYPRIQAESTNGKTSHGGVTGMAAGNYTVSEDDSLVTAQSLEKQSVSLGFGMQQSQQTPADEAKQLRFGTTALDSKVVPPTRDMARESWFVRGDESFKTVDDGRGATRSWADDDMRGNFTAGQLGRPAVRGGKPAKPAPATAKDAAPLLGDLPVLGTLFDASGLDNSETTVQSGEISHRWRSKSETEALSRTTRGKEVDKLGKRSEANITRDARPPQFRADGEVSKGWGRQLAGDEVAGETVWMEERYSKRELGGNALGNRKGQLAVPGQSVPHNVEYDADPDLNGPAIKDGKQGLGVDTFAADGGIEMRGLFAGRISGGRQADFHAYGGGGGGEGEKKLNEKPLEDTVRLTVDQPATTYAVPETRAKHKVSQLEGQEVGRLAAKEDVAVDPFSTVDTAGSTLAAERDDVAYFRMYEDVESGTIRKMGEAAFGEITDLDTLTLLRDHEAVEPLVTDNLTVAFNGYAEIVPEPEEETPSVFLPAGHNPWVDVDDERFSTFSIDVDTAAFTLTRKYIREGFLPPPEAVRTEEFVNFFDYQYPAPSGDTFAVYPQIIPAPFGSGHLLKIGVKGRRLGREEQRPAVLTLVIDTSGSMNTPDRLGLVKQSLRMLIDRLAPQDRVAVIQYASRGRLVLEHTPAAEKETILAALDRLAIAGSTHLEQGLQLGYQQAAAGFVPGAENRVLLLSDGMANLGSDNAAQILERVAAYRKQGITISVFGFGIGNYNDPMLETLADKGDGVYRFIDSLDEARRVFVDDLAATLNVIARDVKIQVEFNPARVKHYRQLGYENRQLTTEQFRDDTVDAGEVGSGQSVTAMYKLQLDGDHALPFGFVRVRYRDVRTGRVEEIERPLNASDLLGGRSEVPVHVRLAATAAEFAEILRGSPFVEGHSYQDVAGVLRPVAMELHLDPRVQELMRMVQAAGSLPRAAE